MFQCHDRLFCLPLFSRQCSQTCHDLSQLPHRTIVHCRSLRIQFWVGQTLGTQGTKFKRHSKINQNVHSAYEEDKFIGLKRMVAVMTAPCRNIRLPYTCYHRGREVHKQNTQQKNTRCNTEFFFFIKSITIIVLICPEYSTCYRSGKTNSMGNKQQG